MTTSTAAAPDIACPDCAVAPGRAHQDGCDVARCHATGAQRLGCAGVHQLDGVRVSCYPDVWSGTWPGEAECRSYELMLGPDLPDLNRLMLLGRWDIPTQRWVWPR